MTDKGAHIERFYWLVFRLCVLLFGGLVMLTAVLLGFGFFVEQWQSGLITLAGRRFPDVPSRAALMAAPVAMFAAGFALVARARRGRASATQSGRRGQA